MAKSIMMSMIINPPIVIVEMEVEVEAEVVAEDEVVQVLDIINQMMAEQRATEEVVAEVAAV